MKAENLDDHGDGMQGVLVETLANIMHFCHQERGVDFDAALLAAHAQFRAELAQQRRGRHQTQPSSP